MRPVPAPSTSRRRLAVLAAALVASAVPPAPAAPAARPVVHHDLRVSLSRDGGIEVRDTVTLPATWTGPRRIVLGAGLHLVGDPAPPAPGRAREIRYAGRPRGVGADGAFLHGGTGWYPRFADERLTFAVEIAPPPGWIAVAPGAPGPDGEAGWPERWRETAPQEQIALLAGPWTGYRRSGPVAPAMVALRHPDPDLAARYLAATGRHLAFYDRLLGAYPYAKFAVVETSPGHGYGLPSLALLGPRVIRLPFIPETSLPHEIVHTWLGNAVYVDPAGGNWTEGITAYLADHLAAERAGRGAAHRRIALEQFRSYVGAQDDMALAAFRARHDPRTAAIGYHKAMMVFHMLRRRIGDAAFVAGLRRLARERRFARAGWAEVRGAFEAAAGSDLGAFFAQWVQRPGAPRLALREARASTSPTGTRLHLRLAQTQPGPPYDLRVPVVVSLAGGAAPRRAVLEMAGPAGGLDLDLGNARPTRVDVDPASDVFRRLERSEVAPSVAELRGAPRAVAVVPAEPALARRYRALAAALGADAVRADDAEVSPGADTARLVLGWENRLLPRVAAALGRGARLSPEGFATGGRRWPRAEACVALALRLDGAPALFVGCDREAALPGLGRKLPHYGRYGYVVFAGDEPLRRAAGRWPAPPSPLAAVLAPGGEAPPRLAPRAPLAAP